MAKTMHNFYGQTQTTFNMGQLIPIDLFDVLPGDRLTCRRPMFLRTETLLAPAMTTLKVYRHDWFIPYRLVWNNELFQNKKAKEVVDFMEFMAGKGSSKDNPMVRYNPEIHKKGTLWDYFGFPVKIYENPALGIKDFTPDPQLQVSILPFVGFWLIYANFYADELLQNTEDNHMADVEYIMEAFSTIMEQGDPDMGVGTVTDKEKWLFEVPYLNWKKDVFTTARPYTQLGEAVTVPVNVDPSKLGLSVKTGQHATLHTDIAGLSVQDQLERVHGGRINVTDFNTNGSSGTAASGVGLNINKIDHLDGGWHELYLQGSAYLRNDVLGKLQITGEIDAATLDILDLSRAVAKQKLQFNDLKWGTRYKELLLRFGVDPRNKELQLPQFLGGSSDVVQLSDVTQTGATDGINFLGDMAGKGVMMSKSNKWAASFDEWGFIISLAFVRPDALYSSQGVSKNWTQRSRDEFFWPEYENLGMQEIKTSELWAAGQTVENDEIFGYNDMYYYYRSHPSRVTGDMRDLQAHWTLARNFNLKPALNENFIKCRPSPRIFAALNFPQFKLLAIHELKGFRNVSKTARFSIG